MSLDVYLRQRQAVPTGSTREAIFIREDGQNKEISREEWDRRQPHREPMTVEIDEDRPLFHANITHNLGAMADKAGIYQHLWHPEDLGMTQAKQLILPLSQALIQLTSNPEHYRAMNLPNGWGTYEGLLNFVARYLSACEAYPDAEVVVWR